MTEFEYQCSAARIALRDIERTRDNYVSIIECLGMHGRMTPYCPVMPRPAALAEVYSRMLVVCEKNIRDFRTEYAHLL